MYKLIIYFKSIFLETKKIEIKKKFVYWAIFIERACQINQNRNTNNKNIATTTTTTLYLH